MSFTPFPHGITSMGVPVFGDFPRTGNTYFVDPTNANASNSNDGTDINAPLKSILTAYNKCTTGQNDVIYYIAGTTGADNLSATLTWSKSYTHLIGVCAPVGVANRARIFQTSTATGVSPLLDVTGSGNIFSNLYFFHGVNDATSLINVRVTGQRNYFHNCHFAGIGNATQSAAGGCDLSLDGGAENLFDQCYIGLDTIARDADPVNILFDSAATRNHFRNCFIYSYISAAGYTHVKVADATGIDRWQLFENCLFHADSENRATSQTQVMNIPAISQGKIILHRCYYGTDNASGVWQSSGSSIIRNTTDAPTASGAGGEMSIL